MAQFLISTTGADVVINDLGGRTFIDPTVDFDLYTEYTEDELFNSTDLQALITGGDLTAKDTDGNAITDVKSATSRFDEAPDDGEQYARKNLAWDIVEAADIPGFPVGRWTYEAGTTPPPSDNNFRFDDADPMLATEFYIDDNNSNGVDLGFIFGQIGDLGVFYIQVAGDDTKYWYVEVLQGTDDGGYWTFPIVTVIEVGTHATGIEYGILLVTAGQGVGNVPEAPNDGEAYRRESETWVADPIQDDAPNDGKFYGRRNLAWETVELDHFADSSILGAPFSTTEDTYQDVLTHTFTPPEAGDDWQLSCTIAWTITDKQKLAYFRFTLNGVPSEEIAVNAGEDDTVNVEYIIKEELAVPAALQTLILQTRNMAGESETITVERARFVSERFRNN